MWGQKISRLILMCLGFCLLTGASKVPSAYDGYRDGFVDTGHQNMPFILYGVAIKWNEACRKGKVSECVTLAEAFEVGLGDLRPEMRVALGYWRIACTGGNGYACARAAEIILSGEALYKNPTLARQTAERGCTALKNQRACAAWAQALGEGPDAAQNAAKATALIDQACAAGDNDGCRLKAKALFYDRSDAAGHAAAIPLFEKACTAKKAWGCIGLTDAYEGGKGVTRDPAKARVHAQTGCEAAEGDRVRACRQHGTYLTQSTDKASLNKGESYLNTSCTAGDGQACLTIGKLGFYKRAGATTTDVEALYYLRRGCNLDVGEACAELASAFLSGGRLAKDDVVAFALYEKACRLNWKPGCTSAQNYLVRAPKIREYAYLIDPASTTQNQLIRAQEVVKTADKMPGVNTVIRLMQEGDEDASWLLGGWLYYGLEGVFDTLRKADGIILIENAARVGHVDAAIWLGMAYWYGDGVPEDRKKGEDYMWIAATRGSEKGEAIYRSMKAEPIRQENARRQKEMEEAAKNRQNNWASSWSSYASTYSSSSTYSPSYKTSSSGQSVSSIIDNSNWNQRYNYLSGASSVCPTYNPYC